MNMKKLLAGVVGVTVLMSNVAFAAVTTTTTYKGDGTVEVKTNVSGINTPNAMVTYVLYGEKDRTDMPFNEETGEVLGTTKTKPDENNIIYIDQDNNVTGSTEFTAPGLTVGQAYGAKVIVGTDSSDDVSVPENEYTGDMYTLQLPNDAADYTVKVNVNMGVGYIKDYELSAGKSVNVPVGAQCQVTFTAVSGKVVTKAMVGTTEVETESNLSTAAGVYTKGSTYVLSAVVENETNPAIITVSDPIKQVGSVMFLVTVNQFEDLRKTGLKVAFNGHTFENLVPVQYSDNYYAIEIRDDTDKSELGMTESTDYKVTAFVKVNDVPVYDGDQGSTDYLKPTYGGNVE